MTELADDFRLMRKDSQQRRANNRAASAARLEAAGIAYTAHNGGAHLIVAEEWNFWPGTGRWCHRGPPTIDGRGVANLIRRIRPMNLAAAGNVAIDA